MENSGQEKDTVEKPLHERITQCVTLAPLRRELAWSNEARALLHEAAEALRKERASINDLAACRNATLEEAAALCHEWAGFFTGDRQAAKMKRYAAITLAKAIRALKS